MSYTWSALVKWLLSLPDESCRLNVAQGTTNTFNQSLFFPPTHKKHNKLTKAQSIEWGDRFTASQGQGSCGWMLSWSGPFSLSSFLSLRCRLGSHPSPSIPLFCLFYINTIRAVHGPHWFTFSLSVGLPCTHTHVQTHTLLTHSRIQWALLTKRGGLVKGPPSCHRSNIDTYRHLEERFYCYTKGRMWRTRPRLKPRTLQLFQLMSNWHNTFHFKTQTYFCDSFWRGLYSLVKYRGVKTELTKCLKTPELLREQTKCFENPDYTCVCFWFVTR